MSEPLKPQPQLTPEQLKQMAMLQQMMQQKNLSKRELFKRKVLTALATNIQKMVMQLDRFVNFIVKKEDVDRNDVIQAARAPILFGVYIIILVVGIGFFWSAVAPLDSAAHARGTLVSSSNKKIIQHNDGGIIKAIYVKQGDIVKEGQVLIKIDDTAMRSKYENMLNAYRTYTATENRLVAERDNLDSIAFDQSLINDLNIPEVAKIIHTQENIFRSKLEVIRSEKESIKQKITQLNKQQEGLEAKRISVKKAFDVTSEQLKSAKALFAKEFLPKAKLLEIEAREAGQRGELAGIDSDISRTAQEITRAEIDLMSLQNKYNEKTFQELRETQVRAIDSKEHAIAVKEALDRTEIKSPVDGIVNMITPLTVGGVIRQSDKVAEISPSNDHLVIEARIPEREIYAVHVGLKTKINFVAFKSRTTPTFNGVVVSLSPDIMPDERQSPEGPVYIARIEINMDEFNKVAKAKNLELHPGMSVDVNIVRGTRTLLRYLLDPLTDTMFHALKEK